MPDDPIAEAVKRIKGGQSLSLDDLTKRIKALGFSVGPTTATGGHNPGSLHYSGQAADISIHGKSTAEINRMMGELRAAGYNVRDERTRPPGQAVWHGSHIHAEFGGKGGAVLGQAPTTTTSAPSDPISIALANIKKAQPVSKADERSAYYERATAARRSGDVSAARLDKLASDIDWHFGYSILQEMRNLPEAKQIEIARKATELAAADEEKRKQYPKTPIVKSPAWQLQNQRAVGIIEGKDIPAHQPPDVAAGMQRDWAIAGNPLAQLPAAVRFFAEPLAAGLGSLAHTTAGVKIFSPGIAITDALLPWRGKHFGASGAAREVGDRLSAMAGESIQLANRPWYMQAAQDMISGGIASTPAVVLTMLGVPPQLAFAMQGAAEAQGRGDKFTDVVMAAVKGGILGELWEMPFLSKSSALKEIGKRMGAVGLGSLAIDMIPSSTSTSQGWEGYKQDLIRNAPGALMQSLLAGAGEFREGRAGRRLGEKVKVPEPPRQPAARGLPSAKFDIETGTPQPGRASITLPGKQTGRAEQVEPGTQGELFTGVAPGTPEASPAGREDLPGFYPEPLTIEQYANGLGLDPASPEAKARYEEYRAKVRDTAGKAAPRPPRHVSWEEDAKAAEDAWKERTKKHKYKESVEQAVKAAIAYARENGPTPAFRAFFGGIEPKLAGSTIADVRAFAKTLGMKWEPQEGWAAAEQQAEKAAKEAPAEPAQAAGPVRGALGAAPAGTAETPPPPAGETAPPGEPAAKRVAQRTGQVAPQQQMFTLPGTAGEQVPIFDSRTESPQDALVRLDRLRHDPEIWQNLSPEDRRSIGKSIRDLKAGKSPAQIMDEAGLTNQFPGVMRMSEETARRNLQEMKAEFNRLVGKSKEGKLTPDEKRAMGALKQQIEALEKQQAGELGNVPRETSTTEERTRPRWTTREQLGATPEQLKLMRREQVAAKGKGVRIIPKVDSPTVTVNDPAAGEVEVPVWQQLDLSNWPGQGGYLNFGDVVRTLRGEAEELGDVERPRSGVRAMLDEAERRAEADRFRHETEAERIERPPQLVGSKPLIEDRTDFSTSIEGVQNLGEAGFANFGDIASAVRKTYNEIIDEIQKRSGGMLSIRVLESRLPKGEYEQAEVPIDSVVAPYVQPIPARVTKYAKRGAISEASPIIVNEKGEVVDGNHRLRAAQQRGEQTVKVWKPVGVELKPQEPWTGGQPDWVAPKRETKAGVKVVKKGEPTRAETIKSLERAIEQTRGRPEQAFFENLLKDYVTGADRGFKVTPEGAVERIEPAKRGPRPLPTKEQEFLARPEDATPVVPSEPGLDRFTLGVQKTKEGWFFSVRDTHFPDKPPLTEGPFPTRDGAIDAGGARTTRYNQTANQRGWVNVGDVYDAVGDFMRGLSGILPKEISKDLYAATIKSIQGHERAQAEMGASRTAALDSTYEAAEISFNRLPVQIQQDVMLARGVPELPGAQKIQADSQARLRAITDPHLRDMIDRSSKALKEGYDFVHAYAVKHGVNVAYRPDYFYGVWDAPKEQVDRFIDNWSTTERYKKQKAIPTVADGLAYGLKLRDPNPFTNMRKELIDVQRRVSMKELAEHLRTQTGVAVEEDKVPFADRMRLRSEGWVALKDPAFQGLLVEPTYGRYLSNLLSTNYMNATTLTRGLRQVNRFAQKAKFMGSLFHAKNMVKASIAVEAGGIFNPKGWKDAFYTAMRASVDLRKAGIDPLGKDHLDYTQLSGGHRYAVETEGATAFGQELNVLVERAMGPQAGRVVRTGSQLPGLPGFQRWLFNQYIPALKEIKYFRDLHYQESKLGRELTDYEKIDIIKRNQNFYGEMNERLFGRSAGATTALRIPFTAPGFGEGNLRTMARAIKEPLEAVGKLRRGEKLTKMDVRSAQFMIQSWIFSAMSAQLGTRLLTGQWATPSTIREMFLLNTGEQDKDGSPIYFDMLSYDKDYWTALSVASNTVGLSPAMKKTLGVQPTAAKAFTEARQRVAGAEAPVFNALIMFNTGIMTGQVYDWRGRPLIREGDTKHNLLAIGNEAVNRFEPIAISTIRQALQTGIPPWKATAYSVFGTRPLRMPGIYQLAHDFNVTSGNPPMGVFEPSEYQGFTDALGTKNAQSAFEELHKTKTRGEILKYYKERVDRPLTGSKEREAQFLSTLTKEQRHLYDREREQRRRDLQRAQDVLKISAPISLPRLPALKKPSVYDTK